MIPEICNCSNSSVTKTTEEADVRQDVSRFKQNVWRVTGTASAATITGGQSSSGSHLWMHRLDLGTASSGGAAAKKVLFPSFNAELMTKGKSFQLTTLLILVINTAAQIRKTRSPLFEFDFKCFYIKGMSRCLCGSYMNWWLQYYFSSSSSSLYSISCFKSESSPRGRLYFSSFVSSLSLSEREGGSNSHKGDGDRGVGCWQSAKAKKCCTAWPRS